MPESNDLADLAEVLRADQRRRWLNGEKVLVEDYVERHPAIAQDREAFLDFVYAEYCLREELDTPATREEFYRRFPALADRLKPLFAAHLAMACSEETNRDDEGSGADGSDDQLADTAIHHEQTPDNDADRGIPVWQGAARSSGVRPANAPPEFIGRYQVSATLGFGGFGTVYRAFDPELKRDVAVDNGNKQQGAIHILLDCRRRR